MNYNDIGIDTASLAGSLESRLAAARQAGFSQVMISATDIVGHPAGVAAGMRAVRESGLRVTGLEALRDFEGLAGQLHAYKLDVAMSMLELCSGIDGRLLLVEASTSTHADAGVEAIVRDLSKLALLAIPLVAFFLPVLLTVILGPALIEAGDALRSRARTLTGPGADVGQVRNRRHRRRRHGHGIAQERPATREGDDPAEHGEARESR